jgi:hypothetical protein
MHDKNGTPLSTGDTVRVLCLLCGGTLVDNGFVTDETGPVLLVRVGLQHATDHLLTHDPPSMDEVAHLDQLSAEQANPGSVVAECPSSHLEKR